MKGFLRFSCITICFTVLGSGFCRAQSQQPQTKAVSAEGKAKAEKQFNLFLETWLVKQDIDKAMSFIEVGEYLKAAARKEYEVPDNETFDADLWARKFLCMWLMADHGVVEELDHGNPKAKGYDTLPARPDQILAQERKRWKTVKEASLGVKTDVVDDAVVGVTGLRHTPNDGIVFVFKKISGRWKIVAFFSIAG